MARSGIDLSVKKAGREIRQATMTTSPRIAVTIPMKSTPPTTVWVSGSVMAT